MGIIIATLHGICNLVFSFALSIFLRLCHLLYLLLSRRRQKGKGREKRHRKVSELCQFE